MVRFPPSDQPGVYGVYTPVGGVSRPCALSTTDPMREEYQNGVGRSPAPAPAKTTKKPAAKAREVRPPAEVTRVHNLRYSGADMSLVLARWNPETLEPNPYMLRMSPVWQDPHDFRPWLELVEELEQLLALRRGSYGRDPARPLAEIQRHREMVDAALEARRKLYKERAGWTSVSYLWQFPPPVSPLRRHLNGHERGPGVTGRVSQRTSPRVVATSVVAAPTVQDESAAAPSSARGRATSQAAGEVMSSSSAAGRAEPQLGGPPELVDLVEVAAVALQRVADYLRMHSRRDN